MVEIQDELDGYRITRYRKHKEFKNQTVVESASGEGALLVDISKGTEKETQEVINAIMGCSLDVFMAAIYAGQEAMPDIPKMTDKQLKLLIEEAAGVERLEAAYEIARGKLSSAKAALTTSQTLLSSAKSYIATTEADIATTNEAVAKFEAFRVDCAKVFKDNAESRRTALLSLGAAIKSAGEGNVAEKLKNVSAELAEHSKKLARRDELKALLGEAQRNDDRANLDLERLMKDAAKLKASFDNAETEVKKPCPTCGKVGATDHDVEAFKEHTKAKLTEVALKVKEQKAKVTECAVAVKTRIDELAAYEATLPDVSDLSREQNELNAKMREIAKQKSDFALQKKEFDRQLELAEAAMTETNPHSASVTMLAERLAKYKEAERVAFEEVKDDENKVALFESVVKVFSPAGVRAHILDTVTPFLNDRTSDYLSALSDGNISAVWATLSTTTKGDLKEKFNIEVVNDKGADSFAGLSGGEKRKVRLATMLALQDLVASRATKPVNLWLGDEIDDALDDAGLERLMGILERKARERGTVLIVSHRSLRDWVDNVMTVTKRDGLSTISGALCLL